MDIVSAISLPPALLPPPTHSTLRSLILSTTSLRCTQVGQHFIHARFQAYKTALTQSRASSAPPPPPFSPPRLAIVGSGALATSLAASLLDSGTVSPPSSLLMVVRDTKARRVETLKAMGVALTDNMGAAAKIADLVFLAVPGSALPDLAKRMESPGEDAPWNPTALVVSTALGSPGPRVGRVLKAPNVLKVSGIPTPLLHVGGSGGGDDGGEGRSDGDGGRDGREEELDVRLAEYMEGLDALLSDEDSLHAVLVEISRLEERNNVALRPDASPALPLSESVLSDALLTDFLDAIIPLAVHGYHILPTYLESFIEAIDS